MKLVDEFRQVEPARALVRAISSAVSKPWTIMEICGGQTHAIVRYGIDQLLPREVTLVHGPGCPVCITPVSLIDQALDLASRPEVTLCTFGDMLRVPGSGDDLRTVKAQGGDVRMVYSPMDAMAVARREPSRQVVFFAVGFETTAPAVAMTLFQAKREALRNFSVLSAHALVPPAMEAILASPDSRIQGFLAAGHVCTVMGTGEYLPLAKRYRVPIVVTGFEPLDLLQGILMCVRQLEQGTFAVENQYARSVRPQGNPDAKRIMDSVFEVANRVFRGLGEIPRSGLRIRAEYAPFDAERRFALGAVSEPAGRDCPAGKVLSGNMRPTECASFGVSCSPEHPLGALMVSSEGACAAYYRYRRSS